MSARALALLLVLRAELAHAAECPVSPALDGSETLARADAETRLRFIERQSAASGRRTRIWAWSWAGGYSAVAVAEVAQYPLRDDAERVDGWFNAGAAAIGVLSLALMPQPVMRDQRWLEAARRRGPPDLCATLATAESHLVRDAEAQAFGKGPVLHLGTLAFNLAVAAILGAGLGHWQSAAIFLLAGEAIGELQIATQPAELVDALARYRAGEFTRGGIGRYPAPLVPSPQGVRVRVDF